MKFKFIILGFFLFHSLSFYSLQETKNSTLYSKVDSLNSEGFRLWIIDPSKSLMLGEQAEKIALKSNYVEGLALAYRIQGVAHWSMGEPKLALETLYKSLDLYKELGEEEGVANAKLNIGMVYAEIDEDRKAMDFFEDAMNIFTKLNLNDRIATTFTKIGSLQLSNGELNLARSNLTNALEIHTKNKFDYGIAEAHNRLGILYIKENNLEQADYHLRKAFELGGKINDQDGLVSNMVQYGRLLRLKGDLETAAPHFYFALKRSGEKDFNNYRLLALKELKELHKSSNNSDSALYYSEAYSQLKDSIFNTQKSRQIAAIEYSNEISEKNAKLSFLTQKEVQDTRIKWILVISIWLIGLLSFFLIKSLNQRNKSQKELFNNKEELAKQQIESANSIKKDLEGELEEKNKELTSYALNFVQKNELLKSLQEKVTDMKESAKEVSLKKKLDRFDKIIRQQNNAERDWQDFKFHFEKVHTDFFVRLKEENPDLSSNDLKVAALTRLNLSIKEMAGIMGISPESAKTARYRLRKKLSIQSEEELFDFLITRYG